MLLIKNYIKESDIHGMGLYTPEPVKKGTQIWAFQPGFDSLVARELMEKLPQHTQDFINKYAYPYSEDDRYVVLEVDNGRFMNHSETPNCDFRNAMGVTLRDIAANEELTCNYNDFCPDFELMP